MDSEIRLSITLSEGKYTFISYVDDYRIHCLRYGEPWMIFTQGHKAISSLMHELEKYATIYVYPSKVKETT